MRVILIVVECVSTLISMTDIVVSSNAQSGTDTAERMKLLAQIVLSLIDVVPHVMSIRLVREDYNMSTQSDAKKYTICLREND